MSNELGTLVIVVLKARNLRDKHSFYKQDVYAQISINGITKKTGVDVKGGQHPVWDEELRVPISVDSSEKSRTLYVSCWSVEPRTDESVGEGQIDISETLRTGEFDDWIPLKVDGTYRGDLYLEMTFYAAGPPPSLNRRPTKMKPSERLERSKQAYVYPTLPPQQHPSLAAGGARKNEHSAPIRRVSPHHQKDDLPPLPEEATVAPGNVPDILRPGKPKTPSPNPPVQKPLPSEFPLYASVPHSIPQLQSKTPSPSPPVQKPLPTEFPLHAQAPHSTLQTQSPPRVPVPALPPVYPSHTSGTNEIPPSLRHAGPPGPQSYNSTPYNYAQAPPLLNFPTPETSIHSYAQPMVQGPSPPSRPYPYNYAPPPRDPDLDLPDPFVMARYQSPLPLPDEPGGVNTPTPAHPQGYVGFKPRVSAILSSNTDVRPSAASRERHEADRDRLLALAAEREEEERKKRLQEQEERDRELAQKLDLELNLNDQ